MLFSMALQLRAIPLFAIVFAILKQFWPAHYIKCHIYTNIHINISTDNCGCRILNNTTNRDALLLQVLNQWEWDSEREKHNNSDNSHHDNNNNNSCRKCSPFEIFAQKQQCFLSHKRSFAAFEAFKNEGYNCTVLIEI